MRKPRDYDAELKALDERARHLRNRRREQLGDVVIATGAGDLTVEVLAGALLAAVAADSATQEAWRAKGAAFFRDKPGRTSTAADKDRRSAATGDSSAPSRDGTASAS